MRIFRRVLKVVAVVVALLFVGVQFVRPEKINRPVEPTRTLEARAQVPAEVASILSRACNDCHTQQTRWPWYSQIAPASWFLADHVRHGRRHLNFSDWARYNRRDADSLLGQICREVKGGTMPMSSYTLIHRDAKLSAQDVRTLCDWSQAERQRLAGLN